MKFLISSASLVTVSFFSLACSNKPISPPAQASEVPTKAPVTITPLVTKAPVVETKKPTELILTDAQRASKLWGKIKGYKTWKNPPGFAGLLESDTVHGDYVRFYANATALADIKNLPNGSIVVKEGFHDDEGDLKAITVMQKIDGAYAASGNWFFSRFDSAGNASKVNSARCIKCHSKDDNGDYSYIND